MARKRVADELIYEIADEMVATGNKNPKSSEIRNELARLANGGPVGSPNSILESLNKWRSKRDVIIKENTPLPQLPERLTAEIMHAINAASAKARDEVESRLVIIQSEFNELVESGTNYDLEIERLTESELSAKADLNTANIRFQERFTEIEELRKALAIEQSLTSELTTNLAKSESQSSSLLSTIDRLEQGEASLRDNLTKVNLELSIANSIATSESSRADVADVRFAGENEKCLTLEARVLELSTAARNASGDAARASAAEASVVELRAQVEMLRCMLNDATNARRASIPRASANFKPSSSLQKTVPSTQV
jgi:SMC interacting uncharacterized protein involved in chromosome segregation